MKTGRLLGFILFSVTAVQGTVTELNVLSRNTAPHGGVATEAGKFAFVPIIVQVWFLAMESSMYGNWDQYLEGRRQCG